MKKTAIFSVLFIFTSAFNLTQAQITFGVKTGLNLSNFFEKNDDKVLSEDYKNKVGANLGLTVDFPINNNLGVQTGLTFQNRGYRIDEVKDVAGYDLELESKTYLNYIDIPINLKYTFELSSFNIYAMGGLYAGTALNGRYEGSSTFRGRTDKTEFDIDFGNDQGEIKSLDYGFNLGAGVEFGAFGLNLTYSHGLANLSNNTTNDYRINNRLISISATYRFIR